MVEINTTKIVDYLVVFVSFYEDLTAESGRALLLDQIIKGKHPTEESAYLGLVKSAMFNIRCGYQVRICGDYFISNSSNPVVWAVGSICRKDSYQSGDIGGAEQALESVLGWC